VRLRYAIAALENLKTTFSHMTVTQKSHSDSQYHLTPDEFQFVTEILNGTSVEEAGEMVGIKRRTAYDWKKKEHIKAAIAAGVKGQVKVIEEFRAERVRVVLPEISKKLEEYAPKAVQVIIDIMHSGTKDDAVRLQAAKEILKMSGAIETHSATRNTEQSLQQKGLTPEAADAIRAKILGIP
jgi:transposase